MADGKDFAIGEVAKNQRETVRVELSQFKGYNLAHLRVWAVNQQGATVPTKSGFGVQVAQLPELIALLTKAEAEARSRGWL